MRSRPLCPAGMYLECATMALQQLLGTDTDPSESLITSSTLVFEQVHFNSPLGTKPDGEIVLQLEQVDKPTDSTSQTWTFSVSTHPPSSGQPKQKSTVLHADGTISLAKHPYPVLTTLQRLVSTATERLMPLEHEADKLTSNRAYGLFSRVVDYDTFFRGISSITLHPQNEAIAAVHLPDGQPGYADTTVRETCDTVMLDVCIQVFGLLVNSNTDYVSSDEVAIMTGVDRVVVARGFSPRDVIGSQNRGLRRVYTKAEVAADQRIFSGDVFVMSEEGEMVAMLCDCRFTKVMISKLEKALDLATLSKDRGPVAPAISGASNMNTATRVTRAISTPSSTEGKTGSSSLPSSTSTPPSTVTSAEEVGSDAGQSQAYEALREMISEYTALDKSEIAHDAILGDLGLDSLASVEIVDQLYSQFGVVVGAEEIVVSSLASLAQRLGVAKGQSGAGKPNSQISVSPDVASQSPMSTSLSSAASGHAKLFSIISELSGTQAEDISPSSTLLELGIDSLALVELREEAEQLFSIGLGDLLGDNTVQDLITLVGISNDPTAPLVGGGDEYRLETMVYKEVDGVKIQADVYFPLNPPHSPMPIGASYHPTQPTR